MTNAANRAVLWTSLAASCAFVAALALIPRALEPSAIDLPLVDAVRTRSAGDAQLVDPQIARDPRTTPRTARAVPHAARGAAIDVGAPAARAAGDAAVRALARRLCGDDYRRTTFETEARARMACLPAGALAAAGDPDPALAVARAALARVAPSTLDERRALARANLPALRAALQDGLVSVAEQAAASLAALGDDADRARLIADAADPASPRAALVARIGLESLAGPGAGLALVEAAAAEREAGPFLAIVPAWTQAHGGGLDPAERAACADSLRAIAADDTRAAAARARALAGLRTLDPEQAAIASLAWLRDPRADAALVRAASGSVRSGDVDARTSAALACDPAVRADVRREIAAAFLGSSRRSELDAALVAAVEDVVRAGAGEGPIEALRARAGARAAHPRPQDPLASGAGSLVTRPAAVR